jgi:hypothetical protein
VEFSLRSQNYCDVCSIPDSKIDEDTKCGPTSLRVPYDVINLRFGLLDCYRSTYRSHTFFVAVSKSDFPLPTTAISHLNNGVFYSFVFHKISPHISGARPTPK